MITVAEAEKTILAEVKDYGIESIYFENAIGRVLAEDLKADRQLPPYDRVTMDGIAVKYAAIEKGIRTYKIVATQAAGETPVDIKHDGECVEIMTGAALPATADTIIQYEWLEINGNNASIKADSAGITKGANIHLKGRDKKQGEIVASANIVISPALISMAASVGKEYLAVRKLPRVVIISSGDELVQVSDTPTDFQVRRSNNYTIKTALLHYGLHADMVHIPDDAAITRNQVSDCFEKYDVMILSGGVSMGKFDYIPQALEDSSVKKLFHKVQQRPGKPFWFGKHENGMLVFAFPGNPVSTFMCLHRFFFPWLEQSLGIVKDAQYAVLSQDYTFTPALQYFLQVKLSMRDDAKLYGQPATGNGSGDFSNLLDTDAFMELPLERNNFTAGEVFRVWPFAK